MVTAQEVAILKDTHKGVFELQLADLVPLVDVFPQAKVVARKIDESNLQAILMAEELPPILVTKTSQGYVIVDGHHRYQALLLKTFLHSIQGYEGEPADLDLIRSLLVDKEGKPRDLTEQEMTTSMSTTIRCKAYTPETLYDLIRNAWHANRTHGMAPKKEALGRYGLWLYQNSRKEGRELSYSQCAAEAGCSKAAILNFASRHAGDETLAEGEMAVEAKEAPSLSSTREKDAKSLARALKSFYRHSEELTRDELVTLVSEAFLASEHDIVLSLAEVLLGAHEILASEFVVE
jgi:hypothetical protein